MKKFTKSIIYALIILSAFACGDLPRDNKFDPLASNSINPVADFYLTGGGVTATIQQITAVITAQPTTNPTGSLMQYRWDINSDGSWDVDWSTALTLPRNYTTVGSESITLEVRNAEGVYNKVTKIITIVNSASPVANFSWSPLTPKKTATVNFDASASTDDDSQGSEIMVRWDFENDGTFDTDWSVTKSASHAYPTAGTYAIVLEVKDKYNIVSSKTSNIQVLETAAPVASFTVNPTSPSINYVAVFDASASSDDDTSAAELQVRWDFNTDGVFDTDWSTTKTADYTFTVLGVCTATLEVKDKFGVVGSTTKDVTVVEFPRNGLVGEWLFSGDAKDTSGNNNNGTVSGATLVADRFGASEKAYSFNGSSKIITPNNSSLNPSIITMSTWIKYSPQSKIQFILSKGSDQIDGTYRVYISQNNEVCFMIGVWSSGNGISKSVSSNNWIHVIAVYDQISMKLFINGVLANTYNKASLNVGNGSNLGFGLMPENSYYYSGLIDDVRIYNRALTDAEISTLYHEGGWTGK